MTPASLTRFRFFLLGLMLSAAVTVAPMRAQTVLSGTYSGGPNSISGDVVLNPSTNATFTNGTTFTGANATFGSSSLLYWQQAQTLSGKALTFSGGGTIYVSGVNHTLLLDSATVATGTVTLYTDGSAGTAITNQGTINHTGGSGSIYSLAFTNSGAITATGGTLYLGYPSVGYNSTNTGTVVSDGSGTTIYLRGSFDNDGTLTAQNSGILRFDGTNTTANLGSVVLASGGRAVLNGTIDNTAATLTAPTGGVFELLGGTIAGGSVVSSAVVFTTSAGYLDNVSIAGDLNFSTANAYVYFKNGTTFTGTNANLLTAGGVYWQQTGTLVGKAFTMANGAYVYLTGIGSALTLGSGTTATGNTSFYSDGSAGASFINQGTISHNGSSGSIYAASFSNEGSITATGGTLYFGYPSASYVGSNTGTLTADGAGTTVYIRGTVDNDGTMTAQNSGVLRFDGANTSANLGNVTLASGGRAVLNGTIDNTSATLTAPTGGSFELLGGTVTGGSIAPGALVFTTSAGSLDNVSITGDLNFSTANAYVYFKNGTTFTGTNGNLLSSGGVYWQQVGTLSGKTLTLADGAYIYVTGVNNSLTLGAGTTATGDISFYSDGSTGTGFVNQGALAHTSSTGMIYASNFSNAGSILATAGTLYFGYPSAGYVGTNTGTITADGVGTTVYIRGNVDNNGTMTAQNSGVLRFDGANTSANLAGVTIASGGRAVLNGTIDNTSATLAAPTGGSFELLGGTVTGGSIAPGALIFTTSAGYLDNVSITGDLNFATPGSYVYFKNGTTFTGANANLLASGGVYWQQAGTLAGKALTLVNASYFYLSGVNSSLTLDSATTATGVLSFYSDGSAGTTFVNQGTLTHTGSSGSIYAASFSNEGTITATGGTLVYGSGSAGYVGANSGAITADGAGTMVYIRGNVDNNGTLTAQNSGILRFDGPNTSANLGGVTLASGGRAQLNGTIDNTSATLAGPTGGAFELLGGTIIGGDFASGAVVFTTNAGYLDNVSITGDLNIGTTSAYVYFKNGATFTGANASLAASSALYWQQVGTLSGKSIALANGAYLYVTGINHALTLASTTTLTGNARVYSDGSAGTAITNQGTITHSSGNGSLYADTFTNSGSITATAGTLDVGSTSAGYDTFNTGSITADGTGTTVYLYGNVANGGTLYAQNSGRLIFYGNNTTANLGAVQVSGGGRALLQGVLDNTSATLNSIIGGSFELFGGTINNGSVAAGALTFTTSGGTLDHVALAGDLAMGAGGVSAYFAGGTDFSGANATLGASSGIYWNQVGTLSGKALTLANNSFLYVYGANHALTLDAATTVTGDAGIYSDGSLGTTITNQGAIMHTMGSGQLYARDFTNSGSITATGGTLSLGYTTGYNFNNTTTGSVVVNGGNVYLNSPFSNNGTVDVRSGTLYASTNLTNGGTGVITGAGTISGNLVMAGGTLAPGNSVGTLTFQSSAFSVTSASLLSIEINGAASDKLVFVSPSSNVDIGSGLLALSVTLLSAPTPGTTYTIMSITSSPKLIAGAFAGLPASGDTFSAMFGVQEYLFTVSYLGNGVILDFIPIPEPSTYALMGAGLAMLGYRGLRRRSGRSSS